LDSFLKGIGEGGGIGGVGFRTDDHLYYYYYYYYHYYYYYYYYYYSNKFIPYLFWDEIKKKAIYRNLSLFSQQDDFIGFVVLVVVVVVVVALY